MAILSNLLVNGTSRLLGKLFCDGETTITGSLVINNQTETSNSSYTGPALSVGAINAKHVEYSYDCIQAKNKETAAANLWLNYYGGRVYLSNGSLIYADNGTFKVPTVNVTTSATIASATIANGSITTLRSGSGTFDNLNVVNTLRSNRWDLQSISQTGGSLYVSPTVKFPNSGTTLTVTKSSTALTLVITDSSITTADLAGITWTANSRVKVSGTINGVVTGTMDGTITSINTSSHTLTLSVSGENWNNVVAGTYSANQFSDLNVMVYQRKAGSYDYRVGIWLNCYDMDNNSATIRIYGGTSSDPNVMIGNLNDTNLQDVNGLEPQGWGLFAQNAYLHGHIVANSGKIGGFTLGTESMYSGDNFPNTNNFYLMPTGSQSSTYNIAGSGALSNWVMTSGTTFGVTKDGKIYATAGKIGGFTLSAAYMYGNATAPAANNLFLMPAGTSSSYTVAGEATNGWTITSGTTFGVTKAGAMYSTSGKIGGWNITGTALYNGVTSLADQSHTGLYLGTDGIRNYNATTGNYVNIEEGIITAVGANIEGSIYADSGEIAGFTITGSAIYNGTTSLDSTVPGVYVGTNGINCYYDEQHRTRIQTGAITSGQAFFDYGIRIGKVGYNKDVCYINGRNISFNRNGSEGSDWSSYFSIDLTGETDGVNGSPKITTFETSEDIRIQSSILMDYSLNQKASLAYNDNIDGVLCCYYYDGSAYTHYFAGDMYLNSVPLKGVKIVTVSSTNQTFKVGSRYDVSFTTPSGYTATNMISVVSSGFVASFYGYINGSKVECWCAAARNIANGATAGTGKIDVHILFIQS